MIIGVGIGLSNHMINSIFQEHYVICDSAGDKLFIGWMIIEVFIGMGDNMG